jgi:membrane-associated protein
MNLPNSANKANSCWRAHSSELHPLADAHHCTGGNTLAGERGEACFFCYLINRGTYTNLRSRASAPQSQHCEARSTLLESLKHLLHSIYDVEGIVRAGGPFLVCLIVFVETGFFVGFFLPGDSLLVTAGVFSAAGVIPLKWLLLPVMLCAIVGDQIGYWIGRGAGTALYRREDSLFFKRRHLQRAHDFYEKYGGKTVILARFVPIIRTFCPPVAGAARMSYSTYVLYDIFGGVLWVGAMILGGYFLGRTIPNIGQRIHYVILAVAIVSVIPIFVSLLNTRRAPVKEN